MAEEFLRLAHVDLVPTLIDACDVPLAKDRNLDGRSLLPLLEAWRVDWPDRKLFLQWHWGARPRMNMGMAVRTARWKLLQPNKPDRRDRELPKETFELFDMQNDPFETKDVAAAHPAVVQQLRQAYEAWFREVAAERNFRQPRIGIGSPRQNPVELSRADWRGPDADDVVVSRPLGFWEIEIVRTGSYDVTLWFEPLQSEGQAGLRLGSLTLDKEVASGIAQVSFRGVEFPAGPGRLEAWLTGIQGKVGAKYVTIRRRDGVN